MTTEARHLRLPLYEGFRFRKRVAPAFILLCDVLAFWVAILIQNSLIASIDPTFFSHHYGWPPAISFYLYFGVVTLAITWFSVRAGHYSCSKPFWDELYMIIRVIAFLALVDLAAGRVFNYGVPLEYWLTTWSAAIFTIPVVRITSKMFLLRQGFGQRPTLIIGTGKRAWAAYRALVSEPMMGCQVAGFIRSKGELHPEVAKAAAIYDSLAVDDIKELCSAKVVFAFEPDEEESIELWIRTLLQHGINDISIIPAVRGIPLAGAQVSHIMSNELLLLQLKNNLARTYARAIKRSFDVCAALIASFLLLPLLLAIAAAIAWTGASPVFGHERIGRGNRPFKCYKFRTMVGDADKKLKQLLDSSPQARAEWERDQKLKNDPRITRIGHFLRRTSLDELPQLWNVIKGDMSLVGPRPVTSAELRRYGDNVVYYCMSRPGVTGLWQVSGRNDTGYDTRVYLDVWYLKNWSLWYDITILLRTAQVLLNRNGAY